MGYTGNPDQYGNFAGTCEQPAGAFEGSMKEMGCDWVDIDGNPCAGPRHSATQCLEASRSYPLDAPLSELVEIPWGQEGQPWRELSYLWWFWWGERMLWLGTTLQSLRRRMTGKR